MVLGKKMGWGEVEKKAGRLSSSVEGARKDENIVWPSWALQDSQKSMEGLRSTKLGYSSRK